MRRPIAAVAAVVRIELRNQELSVDMRRIGGATVVAAAMVLAACGGGGGKGTPADNVQAGGVTTTGKATPAGADEGPGKDITLTAETVVVDGDGGKTLKS